MEKITGTHHGDLVVVDELRFKGELHGSLFIRAGSAHVSGIIEHRVEISAGTAHISGVVKGTIIVDGGTVDFAGVLGSRPRVRPEGTLLLAAGTVLGLNQLGEDGTWHPVEESGFSIPGDAPRFNYAEIPRPRPRNL